MERTETVRSAHAARVIAGRWASLGGAAVFVLVARAQVFLAEPGSHSWKDVVWSCSLDSAVLGVCALLALAGSVGRWSARVIVVSLLVLESIGTEAFLRLGTYLRGFVLTGVTAAVLGPSIVDSLTPATVAVLLAAIALGLLFRSPAAMSGGGTARRTMLVLAAFAALGSGGTVLQVAHPDAWALTAHSPISFFLLSMHRPDRLTGLPGGQATPADWAPSGSIRPEFAELAAARPLDVLCVVLESLRARSFPPSSEAPPMPVAEKMVAEGLSFSHATAHEPRSIKALEALLFATYPTPSWEAASWRRADIALSSVLQRWKRRGFATAFIYNSDLAFDFQGDLLRNRDLDVLASIPEVSAAVPGERDPDAASVAMLDRFLAGTRRHFGAFLWTRATHHPYLLPFVKHPGGAPPPLAAYREAIAHTDAVLASIVAVLEKHHRLDRTVIVLVGDHGEAFGEHPGSGLGHGRWPYEESVHVPLVFSNPRLLRAQIDPSPVQLKDVGATLAWLSGDDVSLNVGRNVFAQADPRGSYAINTLGGLRAAITVGELKYIWASPERGHPAEDRLFDLATDPGELVDLSASRTDDMMHLRDRLFGWLAEWTWRWDATDVVLRYRDPIGVTRLLGSPGILRGSP